VFKFDVHQYEERLKDDLERLERDRVVLKANKELIKNLSIIVLARELTKVELADTLRLYIRFANG
jgi:hypothetical protein